MKSTVFVFVPVDASRRGYAEQLRECLASLHGPESVETEAAPVKQNPEKQPFWSWFISNPRPESHD